MKQQYMKYYANYFRAENSTFGDMLLCRDALRELVNLPEEIDEIVLVPYKRAFADTVKIERCDDEGYRLLANGEMYPTNKEMCTLFHSWIDAGFGNVRVQHP
jgi:hypothetical protein